MEILIPLFVLIVLSGPIGLIAAIMAHRRLGNLERKLGVSSWAGAPQSAQRSAAPPTAAPAATTAISAVPPRTQPVPTAPGTGSSAPAQSAKPAPVPRPAAAPQPPKTKAPRDIESILGGQWLTWAGILALFFGTAFFLGVDLGSSLFGGLPQVLLGLSVAGAFLFIGNRLCDRTERFLGLGLLGGGVALLFLGLFSLYGFHHLVPAVAILPMLFAVATIGATLALKQDSMTVAALTLVGAILTPVILVSLSRDTSTYDAVLPYLVAVNLGAVLVGVRRGWAGLPLGGFVATSILILNWWLVQPRRDGWTFLAVAGSWVVYAAAPWLQTRSTRFWGLARAAVLTANGLFFGLFCLAEFGANGSLVQGAALGVLAVIYVVMAGRMKERHGESEATRLAHITGAALALVAIPVLLDLVWVTVGWTALAGVLIWAGMRERDLWQRLTGLVVLSVGLFRVAFMDLPDLSGAVHSFSPLVNGKFLAGLPALALLGWTFFAYHRYEDRLSARERRWRPSILQIGTALSLWKLSAELGGFHVWRQVHLQESPQIMWLWLALLWATYGLAVVLVDRRWRLMILRMPGYVVLGVGVGVAALQSLTVGAAQFPGYRPFANLPFIQGLLIAGILVYVAWLLNRPTADLEGREAYLRRPALYVTHLFLLLKLSAELVALLAWPDAFAWRVNGHAALLWLVPLWAAYGLGTIHLSGRRRISCLRYPGYGALGLAVGVAFLHTLSAGTGLFADYRPLWNEPFVLGVVLTGLLVWLAWRLHWTTDDLLPFEKSLRTPAILVPILYFFLKVTVEVAAFFQLGTAAPESGVLVKTQLTMSLVWGLYAGVVIWFGFARRFKPVRLLGMSLLGLTIAKVFILDMQSLDRGYRIAAFIGLGVLLLVISLLYQRDRQIRQDGEE